MKVKNERQSRISIGRKIGERLGPPLMTQAEVAEQIGVSRAEISKLEAMALYKVAVKLKELTAIEFPNLTLIDE